MSKIYDAQFGLTVVAEPSPLGQLTPPPTSADTLRQILSTDDRDGLMLLFALAGLWIVAACA